VVDDVFRHDRLAVRGAPRCSSLSRSFEARLAAAAGGRPCPRRRAVRERRSREINAGDTRHSASADVGADHLDRRSASSPTSNELRRA